jgi:hypothetical protein
MRLMAKKSPRQGLSKRLVLGTAALASATVVGVAGLAGATSSQPPDGYCQQGNFKNHGQCVKAWKHRNKPGHGYGGNIHNEVHNNVDVDVDVSGDDNIVEVVVNTVTNIFN